METTESKAISSLLNFMYFADISIVNSGVRKAYVHVCHLIKWCISDVSKVGIKFLYV